MQNWVIHVKKLFNVVFWVLIETVGLVISFLVGEEMVMKYAHVVVPSAIPEVNYYITKDFYNTNKKLAMQYVGYFNHALVFYDHKANLKGVRRIIIKPALNENIDFNQNDKAVHITRIRLGSYVAATNEIILYPIAINSTYPEKLRENMAIYVLAHELEHYINDSANKDQENSENTVSRRAIEYLEKNGVFMPNKASLLDYGVVY